MIFDFLRRKKIVNARLLRKTLAYIKTHPERWDQSHWVDECTRCFAGHASEIANGRLSENRHGTPVRFGFMPVDVRGEAMHALRITGGQADRLFDACNTLEDLDRIVEEIIIEGCLGNRLVRR